MVWWVREDCCGVFCGFMTTFLLCFAAFVQETFVIGPKYGYLHPLCLIYLTLTFLAAASHAKTQFTNPGAVPLNNEELLALEHSSIFNPQKNNIENQNKNQNHNQNSNSDDSNNNNMSIIAHSQTDPITRNKQLTKYFTSMNIEPRFCKRCNQYKPSDAHHCSTCNRCIIRMDHHCPWVNNCVAMFNQKFFLLFLFYTCLCCTFSLISLTSRFISCNHNQHLNGHGNGNLNSKSGLISRKSNHSNKFRREHIKHGKINNNNNIRNLLDNNNDIVSSDIMLIDNGNNNINDIVINSNNGLNGGLSDLLEVTNELEIIYGDWCESNGLDVMFCIMNMFEAILFGLFTCIMSCDQVSSIINNITYIDSIQLRRGNGHNKRQKEKKTSWLDNLSFVFGEPFGYKWFLPLPLTKKIKQNFRNLCSNFD